MLFDEPTADSLAKALDALVARDWDQDVLRAHADTFSEETFAARFRDAVARAIARHSSGNSSME